MFRCVSWTWSEMYRIIAVIMLLHGDFPKSIYLSFSETGWCFFVLILQSFLVDWTGIITERQRLLLKFDIYLNLKIYSFEVVLGVHWSCLVTNNLGVHYFWKYRLTHSDCFSSLGLNCRFSFLTRKNHFFLKIRSVLCFKAAIVFVRFFCVKR